MSKHLDYFYDWIGTDGIGPHNDLAKENEGVYAIFDLKKVYYIGRSGNIKKRLSKHEVYRTLWKLGFSVSVKWIYTDESAFVEKQLIREFNPIVNIH